MRSKFVTKIFALLIIFFMNATFVSSDELRNMEVINLRGNKLPQFVNDGVSVDEIFVYAYDASSDSWNQITHQIDELDANRVGYYFGTKNGIFESNEELLFLARDAGDRAPGLKWIDDSDSRNYSRYEFRVYDDENPDYDKYVYVYRSQTLEVDPNLPVYVQYDDSPSGNDIVEAISYREEHSEGLPVSWKIPESAGGQNINILNGQKVRINADVAIIGEIKITEADIKYDYDNIDYIAGPLRVIRKITFKIEIEVFGFSQSINIDFQKIYYPYHVEAMTTPKDLPAEINKIGLFRVSFDLSTSTEGMTFYNPFNNLVIDGQKDDVDRTLLFEPDYNWLMATGDQGTYLNVFQIEDIGIDQRLYYWDSKSDDTYDGTYNKNLDFKSYGDAGILFRGDVGRTLEIPKMILFYMGANQDSLVGPHLVENLKNPLQNLGAEQSYAIPVIASIPNVSQKQGFFIDVPIQIDDVSDLNIDSVSFDLTYDDSIIEFRDVIQSGTMTEDWNPANLNMNGGLVNVSISGDSPLTGSGDLLLLRYKVIGAEGTSSSLVFAQFETNNPSVDIVTLDGSITALSPVLVAVSLPDTFQQRGLSLSLPVDMSDATGLEIDAVSFELQFDDDILEITGITPRNSLSETWETYVMSQVPDGAQISLRGSQYLEGEGSLIYIDFIAIGDVGSETAIDFTNFQFNDGVPVADLTNGRVSVTQPPVLATSIPDSSVILGQGLVLPVLVENVDEFEVKSVSFTLTYDQSVVNALSMTNEGSITSEWTDIQYTIEEGSISVEMSGDQSLAGEGTLAMIDFVATGQIGDTTYVRIAEIKFNKGYPDGVRDEGRVEIIAPTVMVSLPDTSGKNGELINIPVFVEDVSGLEIDGVTMTISYDSKVLDAIRIVLDGSLAENKGMVTFRDYSGSAYIAFDGVEDLEGAGVLFFIQFSVVGADESSTPLSFDYVTFNGGIPEAELVNGSFTVNGVVPRLLVSMPDTTGFEGYRIKIPILVGDLPDLDVTSASISVTYNHDVLKATGITQQATLTEEWPLAAPELMQGKIDIDLSGPAIQDSGNVLVFIDFEIPGQAGSSSVLHFESMLFNDGVPIATTRDGMISVAEMPVVAVSVPDTFAYKNDGILIPVFTEDLSEFDISTFECTITFNQDVANAASIVMSNTLTENWNEPVFEKQTNLITVKMSGDTNLVSAGILFFIEFDVIGDPDDFTDITIQEFMFGVGIPEADIMNGSLRVNEEPEILVQLPDTVAMGGTSIQIPVIVGDVTGTFVTYINTMISFNPNIIEFTGIETSNSIVSQWDEPDLNIFTNRIHLIMSGEEPLVGEGTLVFLNFNVVGIDDSKTPINFMYFNFNSGRPIAVKVNGSLTVEGVIPVELSTFEATAHNGVVHLQWSTESETNNYGFEIQKSIVDSTKDDNWDVIGFVPGEGTSAIPRSYEFIDNVPAGRTLRYRLKQIDFDGNFKLYESILVEIVMPESIELVQNYPNPFNGSTNIIYNINRSGFVRLTVFNVLGKRVATLIGTHKEPGRYSIEWTAQDDFGRSLTSGVYFYRLEFDGQIITKKMILLE